MVADEGAGLSYWPRWRGPSGQGLVAGTRLSRSLVRHGERGLEGGGARPGQFVADRLGRSHHPDHGLRRRAPAVGAGVSPLGRREAVGDAARRRAARTTARTTRTATRRPRPPPTAGASTCRSAAAACWRWTWTARSSGTRTWARWTRITAPPARRCSTRTASSCTRISTRLVRRRVRHTHRQARCGGRRATRQRRLGHADRRPRDRSRRDHREQPAAPCSLRPGHRQGAVALRRHELRGDPDAGRRATAWCSARRGAPGPTLAIRPGGKGDVTRTHLAWSTRADRPSCRRRSSIGGSCTW